MFESCLAKQDEVRKFFKNSVTQEQKYEKIIELGRKLPPFAEILKKPENLVRGCQSTTYLHASLKNNLVYFEMTSDALISAGLASLLLQVYNQETPEAILKCPPAFLEELGINASLTPSRANGLYSMHLRMKQEALRLLVERPN